LIRIIPNIISAKIPPSKNPYKFKNLNPIIPNIKKLIPWIHESFDNLEKLFVAFRKMLPKFQIQNKNELIINKVIIS